MFLQQIRKRYYSQREKGLSHKAAMGSIREDVFKCGIYSVKSSLLALKSVGAIAVDSSGGMGWWSACGIGNALPWVAGGVVYTAQLGLNYRKYKQGKISKQAFKRSAKLGAVQTASQIGGASGGAAIGFAIGSIASVPGAIVGTVVGGIVGGISGRKLGTKAYEKVELKLAETRVQGIFIPLGGDRSDEIIEVEEYWGEAHL